MGKRRAGWAGDVSMMNWDHEGYGSNRLDGINWMLGCWEDREGIMLVDGME
jgi:hypothetical protein